MFKKLIGGWATKRQKAEAEDFLRRIRVVDGEELGMMVAMVLTTAEMFRANHGWDFFEPATVIMSDMMATHTVSSMAVQAQRDGNLSAAAALMVWTHSLRGIENIEVRAQAREIWSHLSRGFPFAEEGADYFRLSTGMDADLRNLGRFPTGLSPTVS